MTTFNNWRFNPFTAVMHSVPVTAELHDIEYQDEWNSYGIQLDEAPQLDSPSTVTIIDTDTLDEFTEVPRSVTPSAGEFRVDYDAATFYGTGRIQFNAADVGKTVSVDYYGTGTVVKNNYRQLQVATFPVAITFEEDATFEGAIIPEGGILYGGGDLVPKSSHLHVIEDPIFQKGYWDSGTIVDDSATTGGVVTTLRLTGNGTNQEVICSPFADNTLDAFPVTGGSQAIYVVVRLRRDVSLNGTSSIIIKSYNAAGVLQLSSNSYTITNATDLSTSYQDVVIPLINPATASVYIKVSIKLNSGAGAGNLYCSYIRASLSPDTYPSAVQNKMVFDGLASTVHQYPANCSGAGGFIPIYSGIHNLTGSYADYAISGTEAFPYCVKAVLIRYFCDHSGASATATNVFRDKTGNTITLGGTVNASGVNDSIEYYGMAIINVYSYDGNGKANLSGLKNGTSGNFYVHGFFL